ncbi:SfnB family sulfur acquisition oxidoreductase [Paenibacillus sp. GCM10012307]|uniref:Dibenzothiophene monooxygenase n=1 Tax=Paenibacillus roseus TaxID=2798579 RepID=A0A934J7H4_9BACL|nr:SfnB family sulfur acquisition oxidoreductase [Paenibacillus roseus]MBJ6361790.1 SfnB family sulfur acquisition oxidoreductase [Paenibacillus roseus]
MTSSINERRLTARRIQTDEEALQIAREYAAIISKESSQRDRERRLPFDEIRLYAESGLFGVFVPKAYGGPGVSAVTLTEIFRIISQADSSIGQIPQNHHMCIQMLEILGTEEQKSFFFSQVLDGAQFGNAVSERGVKGVSQIKDVLRMQTRLASSENGGYVLNGKKYYSTGALFAQWIPVMAANDEGHLTMVFVPRHAPGVTVIDDWSGIGQRTTASGTVLFEQVEVLDEWVLSNRKSVDLEYFSGAFTQIMHAAIDVGIARAALEDAAEYVRNQAGNGSEPIDDAYIVHRFGELGIKLNAAEALLEQCARSIDRENELIRNELEEKREQITEMVKHTSLLVASLKAVATDTAIELTNAFFELAGTSSMDEKYNYDRHWRNARIHTLHDPVRWKLYHVGNWYLNGVLPKRQLNL